MAAPPRRRPLSSRKRISAIRLSTDTTGSLPAYSSPTSRGPDWPDTHTPSLHDDQPPDYPQSAEEADQEDAEEADREDDIVPLRSPRTTTTRRFLRHRRSESAASIPTSPSVDDLLERSVVALELSTNALLQSMNTQSSISAIANDRILERSLDRQTRMLDLRIRGSRDAHEGWMDDLDQVIKGVDGLFADGADDGAVSRSLPTGDSHMPPRRRPSHLPKSKSDSPYLHLSTSELDLRDGVRPPRALTQYVSVESAAGEACEATADAESIFLPSTTGLRAAAQIRTFANGGARPHRLRQSASMDSCSAPSSSAPSTPAYNMLSHLATQHSSRSPSRTASPSLSPGTSDITHRTTRRYSASSVDSGNLTLTLRRSRSTSRGRSSTSTETPPPVRAMTPPIEEVTPSSSSASSLNAFRAMQSLRKILDEAPSDPKGKRPAHLEPLRRRFQPRSPSVAPSSGTSTATASVSRLFTRSSHRAPHATAHARHSSLKKTSTATLLVPGTLSVPGTPSTTPSTPRNVSFAELPDSYSGEPRRRGKGKEKGKGKDKDKARGQRAAWWSGWFSDVGGSAGAARHEERIEERIMRGWGRPGMGGGGTEEWLL